MGLLLLVSIVYTVGGELIARYRELQGSVSGDSGIEIQHRAVQ